ncbi:MAG: hypothetical protein WDN45_07955 [Caulobacteraceae bacterium]
MDRPAERLQSRPNKGFPGGKSLAMLAGAVFTVIAAVVATVLAVALAASVLVLTIMGGALLFLASLAMRARRTAKAQPAGGDVRPRPSDHRGPQSGRSFLGRLRLGPQALALAPTLDLQLLQGVAQLRLLLQHFVQVFGGQAPDPRLALFGEGEQDDAPVRGRGAAFHQSQLLQAVDHLHGRVRLQHQVLRPGPSWSGARPRRRSPAWPGTVDW